MQKLIFIIILSYLIGCFSTSYIFGKLIKNVDIRNHGSGNAGTTNALRVFGKKIAAITFLVDALKGVLAVYIGMTLLDYSGALYSGVAVIVGHNWPIFLKFKGGKGVATTMGVMLFINPFLSIIIIIIGTIVLLKTKYVSLASIIGMILLPFVSIIVKGFKLDFFLFTLIIAIMAIYKHRSNIGRLINGNESKVGLRV